ncbi:Presqualene diphosphate phosphatase [Rhynchospora pubera]|uniref:Presqualene diphosphate phosphatase n=1 Tax=Rhynchospora pubera TaxID=906938 RepID=A0AAV8BUV6_9POAL|nr:Presqualene diphosphate phosphatase [Rhynchospora pubera]
MATPISTPTTAIRRPSSSFLQSFIALDTSLSLHLHTFFQFIPRFLLKSLEICGDHRLFFSVAISLLFLLSPSLPRRRIPIRSSPCRAHQAPDSRGESGAFAADHWSFPSGHSSRVFFVSQFFFLSIENVREVLQDDD